MFNPKSMITDQTGRHEVMLSINHNQDKICDKRNSKTFFASSEIKKPYLSYYTVLLVLKSGELMATLTRFENFVMVMARGGSYFPYILFKWNPNDVLTTCKAISKAFASVLIMRITSKTIDQRSSEKTKAWRSKEGLFLIIVFW